MEQLIFFTVSTGWIVETWIIWCHFSINIFDGHFTLPRFLVKTMMGDCNVLVKKRTRLLPLAFEAVAAEIFMPCSVCVDHTSCFWPSRLTTQPSASIRFATSAGHMIIPFAKKKSSFLVALVFASLQAIVASCKTFSYRLAWLDSEP